MKIIMVQFANSVDISKIGVDMKVQVSSGAIAVSEGTVVLSGEVSETPLNVLTPHTHVVNQVAEVQIATTTGPAVAS